MRIKIILVICTFTAFGLSAQSSSKQSAKKQLKSLEWMVGTWNRTNVRPGSTALESWTKASKNAFEGIGVSMKGADTTFVEKLRIEIKDNELFYVADVSPNKEPTYFKITSISENGFVSENPDHDFPKMISYELKGTTLTAIISDGGDKKMGFVFEKKDP